jgi:hypothetical protein
MIPSDLVLKVGVLVGYNNNIVIASDSMKIGQNEHINQIQIPSIPNNMNKDLPSSQNDIAKPQITSASVNPVYVGVGISFVLLIMFYGFS